VGGADAAAVWAATSASRASTSCSVSVAHPRQPRRPRVSVCVRVQLSLCGAGLWSRRRTQERLQLGVAGVGRHGRRHRRQVHGRPTGTHGPPQVCARPHNRHTEKSVWTMPRGGLMIIALAAAVVVGRWVGVAHAAARRGCEVPQGSAWCASLEHSSATPVDVGDANVHGPPPPPRTHPHPHAHPHPHPHPHPHTHSHAHPHLHPQTHSHPHPHPHPHPHLHPQTHSHTHSHAHPHLHPQTHSHTHSHCAGMSVHRRRVVLGGAPCAAAAGRWPGVRGGSGCL
jgi:hypothetical protein